MIWKISFLLACINVLVMVPRTSQTFPGERTYSILFSKWPITRCVFNFKSKFQANNTQKKSVSLQKNKSSRSNKNRCEPPLAPCVPEAIHTSESDENLFSTSLQSCSNNSEVIGIEDDSEFHSARFDIPLIDDEENPENYDFDPSQIINNDLSSNEEDSEPMYYNASKTVQKSGNFFFDALKVFYSCVLGHPVLRFDTTFLGAEKINLHMSHVLTNWACHTLKRRPFASKNAVIDDISKEVCDRLSEQGKEEIHGIRNCIKAMYTCSENFFTRLVDSGNVYTIHSYYGRIISPPKGVDPPPIDEDDYEVVIFCPYSSPEDTQMSSPIEEYQQNDLLGIEPLPDFDLY